MLLIVCLDDKGGMAFNRRRQSKDRVLREQILALSEGRPLWMNSYSSLQFEAAPNIRVDEDFLEKAGQGEYCFAEFPPLAPYAAKAERILAARWNRVYPADAKLDIPLKEGLWNLAERREFPGSSHETITLEVYKR